MGDVTQEIRLDAGRIHEMVLDSLFKDNELPGNGAAPENAVVVETVMRKFGLHHERLESHRSEVAAMLADLPEQFQQKGGGGWSFLNACMDKRGSQWAEHVNIDELLALGIGLGLVKFSMPRDIWNIFPGGMPYFVVKEL